MKLFFTLIAIITFLSPPVFAAEPTVSAPSVAPQPTTCIQSTFSVKDPSSPYWKDISLNLKNNCGRAVDFQNASITFINGIVLNTNFWGNFAPLPYPDSTTQITSVRQADGKYLATINLHFPSYPGATTILPANRSITINYGASNESHVGNANVYLGTPVATGTISLVNTSAKPSNVSQNYALIHLKMNGQAVSDVQLPWNSTQNVNGLAPGAYAITADSVSDSVGNSYLGSAVPATLNLAADQIIQSTISYALAPQTGKAAIQLQALPSQLVGYAEKPVAQLTLSGTSSSVSSTLTWNAKTTISNLVNGKTYNLSTPNINYNGYACIPTFTPISLVANATTIPVSNLTYQCTATAFNNVTLQVTGAPITLNSFKITLMPSDGSTSVTKTVSLSNGSGSSVVSLPNNVSYTVSSDVVSGYTINYNPQPLKSIKDAIETVTLTSTGGKTPVEINGQLKVCGTQICNQNNLPIQLRGMSTHGLQWYGLNVCLTQASLDALVNSFKANVIRLSLYVQEGGYETDPTGFTNQVNQLITEATKRGIYVLVDWHILTPGDPNYNLARAKKFFTDVATANKGKVNLIYEIANEPNGVTWATIKSYAEQLIPVIRAIDSKSIILVGTPDWSSLGISGSTSSQEIINNPLNFSNIMYSFHFYAASHRDEYLNELDKASNSLPIFVSEWGSQTYTGDGANDFAMSDKYIQLMANKKISWTNWNFSDDSLSGAIWKSGTCSKDSWVDGNLKASGVYVKSKIIGTAATSH